jgi:hypothetical protein
MGNRRGRGLPAPPLTENLILAWADAHQARTGGWPGVQSGLIEGAPLLTWWGVDLALRRGWRGLTGGDTLPGLLTRERGARDRD